MMPIEKTLEQVDWIPADAPEQEGDLPFATHSGVFKMGDISLRCYRLNNGLAVFYADDFERFFTSLGA